MTDSIWKGSVTMPVFAPLRQDIKTDVLIIGGGLTGILCAYMLQQAGIRCVLVEADRLCSGTTGKTTAKITAQHGLIYAKLLRRFGAEPTRLYLEAQQAALQRYRQLCGSIACDFETKDSYIYSRDGEGCIERELEALARIGFPAEYAADIPLPFPVAGAVRFKNQAQFDPLRFAAEITKGLCIYEHTAVRELIGLTAVTDHGKIRASRIIAATHFPFLNKHGAYFLKLYQYRSYVLALEQAQEVNGMYMDQDTTGLSFRNYGDLLLLGGGAHRTGKQGGNWSELALFARKHYPEARERCRWAAQDCMSLDDVPYVGRYGKNTPGLFVASGFNKWGMTSAMAAAMLLCDLVQGKENPWEEVFRPDRTILRPQLLLNGAESALNFLTPSAKRCPHLGCALKWNSQEHSWDCPCHGSRFTEQGKLIDNPATGDWNSKK